MLDKKLLELLEEDKKYIFFMVICNLLTTVVNVVFAFGICHIYNFMIKGEMSLQTFTMPFAMACGAVLFRFVLSLMNGHFAAKLGGNAKEMLRSRIYDKMTKLGMRETNDLSLASLTQVGIEGVEQLDLYYSMYIPQFFYSVISPFLLFIVFMFISKSSAIILLCCVPLIPVSIIMVSKYAKKIFAKYWGQYAKMGDQFFDQISGMKELKIFHADERYHNCMNEEAEEFRKITMKVLTMQLASTTIMDLVAYGGAGIGIAIAIITRSSINPLFALEVPALILFIVLIAVDFFLPLRALGSAFHVSMNGVTAGKKILALLDAKEPIWGESKVNDFDVSMEHVNFSYDGNRQILKDVSLTCKTGEIVAISGSSGCGKSTIISLLAGFKSLNDTDGTAGKIRIGEKELSTLSRKDYYSHVGVVSYNSYIFNCSIRENFQMAKETITEEEIYERLEQVNLASFVKENGGLDLVINESSANISGGQRQRLALAIGLASDKEIYFFDEVTSNIDADSEKIIMDNIYAMGKEKTIIIISHRLKNIVNASRIYVLDQGQIVEEGTHEQLMRNNQFYGKMYETQRNMEGGL